MAMMSFLKVSLVSRFQIQNMSQYSKHGEYIYVYICIWESHLEIELPSGGTLTCQQITSFDCNSILLDILNKIPIKTFLSSAFSVS